MNILVPGWRRRVPPDGCEVWTGLQCTPASRGLEAGYEMCHVAVLTLGYNSGYHDALGVSSFSSSVKWE